MRKIKKGDTVVIATGRDKGRTGKVITVCPKSNRLKVENANMVTEYVKQNPRTGTPGAIVKKEAFIAVSNVAIFNPVSQKADKIKFSTDASGKKIRCYKSNNERIDI